MFLCCNLTHNSGNALKNIDGRIMIFMSQFSRQHDMPIQNTSCRICNRFVKIITVYQNGIQPGNWTLSCRSGTFQQFRHLAVYTRRISTRYRRLTGSKSNLSLCHGKSCQTVHHKKHIFSLISEIFGNGCRRFCRFISDQCRFIRSCDNYHTSFHAFLTHISLYEFPHFSSTFPNQGNYIDICFCISCKHTKQCTFTNTTAGKNTNTLTFSYRNQSVYRLDT